MKISRISALALALMGTVTACGDPVGPNADGNLTVSFQIASSTDAVAAALDLEGDNGTLAIEEVWLIVDEFKLELMDGACDDVVLANDENDCEEFELPPFFVSVPLEGEGTGEVGVDVPPGSYEELKFETKATGNDDDGTSLLTEIQESHDDWPAEASMLVTGTFTPTDAADAISFRVYFDAEVKVELEFGEGEPLVIEEGGDQSVTVFINPAIWFANDDGTVDELYEYDFDTTEEVFKFEAKFADGFIKIELDDD